MYYVGWAVILLIFYIWKRDMSKIREAHRLLRESLKRERSDFESLRNKYKALLSNHQTN